MLALTLCVLGCGPRDDQVALGEQVPLLTVETVVGGNGCGLAYRVVDVIADPASGTPVVKGGGEPLRWPRGYTARRAGSEVAVLGDSGSVVLTTGGRYWMCPAQFFPEWVIGSVRPCPQKVPDKLWGWYDCKLGEGVL
jgi:hypothetical protein